MASIRKRGAKYQVQVRRKGFASTVRTFTNRKDAQEWARYMEVKADRGDLPTSTTDLNKYKVKTILERYRDEVTVKKNNREHETYTINAFLRVSLANKKLSEINVGHFKAYRDKRLVQVKPHTVNQELSIIRRAFDVARYEWDIPLKNPLADLKKLKVNDARNRRLSNDEYQMILSAIKETRNPYIMPIIDFALETAMRRGEILNLKWSDINFKQRTLHIPIAKNGHARTIPITPQAVQILSDLCNTYGSEGRVFKLTANSVKCAWNRLMVRAGVNDLRFHDLRHEGVSRFFEKGLSIPEVAVISGHRDFRMLFRYTHLRPEDIALKL